MTTNDEAAIRRAIEDWTAAISGADRAAILADHADDVLMFDLPSTVRSIEARNKTWDFAFDRPHGSLKFVPHDLDVTAGVDVAFATCVIHCDGTSAGPLQMRLTTGLTKTDGRWTITHEHHSVPTVEERFVGSSVADVGGHHA